MKSLKYQHKNLASGRWEEFCFLEQLVNIGGEVERAIRWRNRDNKEYAKLAFFRSLELIDLTLASNLTPSQRKEVARVREAWVDFFAYDNIYNTTAESWQKYFMQFLIKLRVGSERH